MSKRFGPDEILRIALDVEERGKSLYAVLENKAQSPEIREVWKHLKEQEIVHAEAFRSILGSLPEYVVEEFGPGDYESYLRAIASDYIFTRDLMKKKESQSFSSDIEALEFGIHVEKESILAYLAVRDGIIRDKHHVLDRIIEEEKKHLILLTQLKQKIMLDKR